MIAKVIHAGRDAGGEGPRILRGTGASDGIVIARALVYQKQDIPFFRVSLSRSEVKAEIDRFEGARVTARAQLARIRARTVNVLGEDRAYIFDAQMLMLDDPLLSGRVVEVIRDEKVNAEWALKITLDELTQVFDGLQDDYLRERRGDIFDVVSRLVQNIVGASERGLEKLSRKYILLAENIRPSDTVQMDWEHTVGLALEVGSRTYHTAILARSLGVPCVVGVKDLMEVVDHGAPLILDGHEGVVIVDPDRELLREYRNSKKRAMTVVRHLEALRDLPAETKDAHRIVLQANIEMPQEITNAQHHGASGIGLFRTEWFLTTAGSGRFPTEDQQFKVYKQLAQDMKPASVIVRAFDVSESALTRDTTDADASPLGLRAVRLLLKRRDLFKTQIRAILRARSYGNVKVMFPMVSGLEEWRNALAVVDEAIEELEKEGVRFGDDLPIGLTLEVPSAAMIVELLAKEAAFISVGTNDLMQYLLGVDRQDEEVAYLYQPLHPALIRTLHHIIEASHDAGIRVGVCGEIAADPFMASLLLGLGIDALSMNPSSIPKVKKVVRGLTIEKAQRVAEKVLELGTVTEITRYVESEFSSEIPKELW